MQKITKGNEKYTEPGYVTEDAVYKEMAQSLIKKAFPEGGSKRINELIQDIKVIKIFNQPQAYILYSGFYEKRTLGEERIPTRYVPGDSDRKRFAREFRRWDLKLPTKISPFQSAYHKIVVPGSRHLDDCFRCGTSGSVPCSCGNGSETCPNCRGSGDVWCNTCGGNGTVKCSHCWGTGQIKETITVYDEHNVPAPKDIYKTCYHCNGSGKVTCGNCRGSGTLICGRCNGQGKVVCSKCRGSMKVTCSDCAGNGYFMDQVYVEQQLEFHGIYDAFASEDALPGEFTTFVGKPEPADEDRCVIRVEDDEPIHLITSEKMFTGGGGSLNVDGLLEELLERIPEDENVHYRNFEAEIRERDLFDIFYTFGTHEYRLRADPVTEVICFEHHPYNEFADSLIKEMEENLASKKWKDLRRNLADYDEALSTSEGTEDTRVTAVRKKYKQHLFTVIAVAVLIVLSAVLTAKFVVPVIQRWMITLQIIFGSLL